MRRMLACCSAKSALAKWRSSLSSLAAAGCPARGVDEAVAGRDPPPRTVGQGSGGPVRGSRPRVQAIEAERGMRLSEIDVVGVGVAVKGDSTLKDGTGVGVVSSDGVVDPQHRREYQGGGEE
jgi:hypothetical protein